MHDWQQRVVEEMTDLDARRGKLSAFMCTVQFRALPAQDRALLAEQYERMTAYSATLQARVVRFA